MTGPENSDTQLEPWEQSITDSLAALGLWGNVGHQLYPNTVTKCPVERYWIDIGDRAPVLLQTIREKNGQLSRPTRKNTAATLNVVEDVINCEFRPSGDSKWRFLKDLSHSFGLETADRQQLAHIIAGMLNGILAVDALESRDDTGLTKDDRYQSFQKHVRACFENYHAAWNLYTRPALDRSREAHAGVSNDWATQQLDAFSAAGQHVDDSTGDRKQHEWWTQSNWLLVRRLLSFLCGVDETRTDNTNTHLDDEQLGDTPVVGQRNDVFVLLAHNDPKTKLGATAPLTTTAHTEYVAAAYLDPIALGVNVLDNDMLDSLTVTARLCDDLLNRGIKNRPETAGVTSLRIAPRFCVSGGWLIYGDSAGGLTTLATYATCQNEQIDATASASFTVRVNSLGESENLDRLKSDVEFRITPDILVLGAVNEDSIEAKVSAENLGEIGVNRVFVHYTQQASGVAFNKWSTRVRETHGTTVSSIDSNDSLADVLRNMSGDAKCETNFRKYANNHIQAWDALTHRERDAEQIPETARKAVDDQPDHMLDIHIPPRFELELDAEAYERWQQQHDESDEDSDEAEQKLRAAYDLGSFRGHRGGHFVELPGSTSELVDRFFPDQTSNAQPTSVSGDEVDDHSWLLVTKATGAGKTVLTFELAALLSERGYLVYREEESWNTIASDDAVDAADELLDRVVGEVAALLPMRDAEARRSEATALVDYLATRKRVVVIFDSLDQAGPQAQRVLAALGKRTRDKPLRAANLRVVVTSRPYAVEAAADEFKKQVWQHVQLMHLSIAEQDAYRDRLISARGGTGTTAGEAAAACWQKVVGENPDREILAYPLYLRIIREIVHDALYDPGGVSKAYATAGDLRYEVARRTLNRALTKYQPPAWDETLSKQRLRPLLLEAACTLAFEMMRFVQPRRVDRKRVVDVGMHRVSTNPAKLSENAADRFADRQPKADDRLWPLLESLLARSVTGRTTLMRVCDRNDEIAFSTRREMEFFAGLYFAKYATDAAIDAVRPTLGVEAWNESWTFAIEAFETTDERGGEVHDDAAYERSIALLFEQPANNPRPTRLMYQAYHIAHKHGLDWFGNEHSLAGEDTVLGRYRQQFIALLADDDINIAVLAADLISRKDLESHAEAKRTRGRSADALRPRPLRDTKQKGGPDESYAVISAATHQRSKPGASEESYTFLMGDSPIDDDARENAKSGRDETWLPSEVRAFALARCSVTRGQYALFDLHRVRAELIDERYGSRSPDERYGSRSPDEDCPMIRVDWFDAWCFCLWLGPGYRLPSEREWEGAAWGGLNRREMPEAVIGVPPYDAGFTSEQVNYNGNFPLGETAKSNYLERTLPVRWDSARVDDADSSADGQMPSAYGSNGFGLWQMSGNVWEWCGGAFLPTLREAVEGETEDKEDVSTNRSLRGGSWNFNARNCRCSDRFRVEPDIRNGSIGFRVARTRYNS